MPYICGLLMTEYSDLSKWAYQQFLQCNINLKIKMKYFVACLLISVAIAAPQAAVNPAASAAPAASPAAASAAINYGPKAYGPGLNNPFALPPNPFLIQRALHLANSQQGLLVRVNIDGEVELTDQFGQEVDGVYNAFGNNLAELYDL